MPTIELALDAFRADAPSCMADARGKKATQTGRREAWAEDRHGAPAHAVNAQATPKEVQLI